MATIQRGATLFSRLSLFGVMAGFGACGSEDPGPGEWEVTRGQVLSESAVLPLDPHPDDPIGDFADITPLADSTIAIPDLFNQNIKVFGPDGELVRTVGRLGDGPGEFRDVRAVVPLDRGSFLALDAGAVAINRFDPDGEYVDRRPLDGTKVRAMSAGRDGALLVSMRSRRGSELFGVARISESGDRTLHHPLPESPELYRGNFQDVLAVETQDFLVTWDVTTPDLFVTSRDGTTEQVVVRADWYEAPAWPEQELAGLGAVTDWSNVQMWGMALESVGENEVLVGFSRYIGDDGSPEQFYALLDLTRRRMLVDSLPTSGVVQGVKGRSAIIGRHVGEASSSLRFLRIGRGP